MHASLEITFTIPVIPMKKMIYISSSNPFSIWTKEAIKYLHAWKRTSTLDLGENLDKFCISAIKKMFSF